MANNLEPLFKVNGIFSAYSIAQPNFSLEAIPDNFAYILDAKGWKLYKKTGIAISLTEVDTVDGLEKLGESISLTSGKIPLPLIRKVTAFFAAVYKRSKSEAVGYLYYNPTTKDWDFVVPTQTASGASASYEQAPQKEGWLIAGTIHSHANMSAFHSGTDIHDEKFFDGIHITIGKLNDVPEYSCSIVAQGVRAKFEDLASVIDGFESEVPPEWMDAVKREEPPTRYLNDKQWGDAVSDLWDEYFDGKISEKTYLKKLDKLMAKIDDTKPIIDASSPSFGFLSDKSDKEEKTPYFVGRRAGSHIITRYDRWGHKL